MELIRTDAVFSRIAMVLSLCRNKSSRNDLKLPEIIFGNNKKYWRKNQGQGAHTLSTRVEGALAPLGTPPSSWAPGAPPTSTPTLYIHVRGEKNQREGFIAFY